MTPEAKAREIVEEWNRVIADGGVADFVGDFRKALQAERDKVERLKAAMREILDSSPWDPVKINGIARAALKEVGEMK